MSAQLPRLLRQALPRSLSNLLCCLPRLAGLISSIFDHAVKWMLGYTALGSCSEEVLGLQH